MSTPLIECVPNFSEGRREKVIEAIVAPFKETEGCYLFDYRADSDHNRLVVSVVGALEPIQQALLEATLTAKASIDMNRHRGGHPRIGAVDVIPFTPLQNITMEACVDLAHDFGQRFFDRTDIPVYFYEEAAKTPARKRLEVIRKGQYEGLKEVADQPERQPDIGPPALHPSAGATVIGARKFLVAYNIHLATSDVTIAKQVAKAVRASSGGMCHVKGIGLSLEDRGMVQVSLNVVDYEKNPLYRVQEMVRMEARRWGVEVAEAEVYGMIPAAALLDSAAYYLQLAGFKFDQTIELKLLQMMGDKK
jgi:glutamate formiminotransferase